MSIGIVIVTHGETGAALVDEAGFVLGQVLDEIICVAVNPEPGLEQSRARIRSAIESAETGDGVVVLTDLMGASPANQVADMLEEFHAVTVTGINLGMLIRVYSYRDKSLELVVRKAVEGGRRAVKIFQK